MRENKITQGGNFPQHIAIIMDGNGRWAKRRLKPRLEGHKQGAKRMGALIKHAFERGVKHVTLFALSTENLKRPQEELDGLFDLFRDFFRKYQEKTNEKEENIRFRVLGDVTLLPADIQESIAAVERKTLGFHERSVNFAVCYGGRSEILRAVNQAVRRGKTLTEEEFGELLYTRDVPDPDLIIRTGDEVRLSNFLLYQAAYAELYFSKKMFPDFSNQDLERALEWYATRTRRFGKTDEQIKKK